jgi:hypothetical protein
MRAYSISTFTAAIACIGIALVACSGSGNPQPPVSVNALFSGVDGGGSAGPCISCIETSCSAQVTALETELTAVHAARHDAFECVRDSDCFASYWSDARDAGLAAAHAEVQQCIAACEAEAGVDHDADVGDLRSLAQALETCVETSCSAQCPGASHDADGGQSGGHARNGGGGGNGWGSGGGNGGGGGHGGGGGQGYDGGGYGHDV